MITKDIGVARGRAYTHARGCGRRLSRVVYLFLRHDSLAVSNGDVRDTPD